MGLQKNDSPLKRENVPPLSTARPWSKVRRDRKIRRGQYLEQDRYSETFPKSEDIGGRKQNEDVEVKRWLENLDWVLALELYIHKLTLSS